MKGEYFEYSAIKALQDSKIIKLPFNYENIKEVTVKEIVNLDELVLSFDDVFKEFEKEIECNKIKIYDDNEKEDDTEEQDEKEENEISDEDKENEEEKRENRINKDKDIFIDNNDKIIINLEKNLDDEKLNKEMEQIISNYFLKDFANIFNKDIQIESNIQKYYYLIDKREKVHLTE